MLSTFRLSPRACAVALLVTLPLPAAASTCGDEDPTIDLDQRIADCEAELGQVWDRSGVPYLVFNLGRALRLAERHEEALPVLHEALSYSSGSALYWAELAQIYHFLGEPGTAAAMYSQAFQADPYDPYLLANRAGAWFDLGRADRCTEDLARVLPVLAEYGASDGDLVWYNTLNGRCLDASGRLADAVAAFDAALAVAPDNVDAAVNRVYALHGLGRYDDVVATTAPLLAPDRADVRDAGWEVSLRGVRIEAFSFLNRPADVDGEIAALVALAPDALDTANLVAWAYFLTGRLDKADTAAEPLRKAAPDSVPGFMLDTLGQVDLALGRVELARDGLLQAAWLEPRIVDGWLPALAAQGYLPQVRFADEVLYEVDQCITELGAKCSLAPVPVVLGKPLPSRPDPAPVPAPADASVPPTGGGDAPPAFEPAPVEPPEDPPAKEPGLGTAPREARPVSP